MRGNPLFVPRAAGLAPRPAGRSSGKNSYMAGGIIGASAGEHEE